MKTLWTKIKTACMGSITMAWSYLLSLGGTFLSNVDSLATVLGDPNLNAQISSVIGDAKLIGKWLLAVGVITAIARLKSLVIPKPSA
jgi:hypothetical protein